MSVVLYVACALLIITVFFYIIFAAKMYLQNKKISELEQKLSVYGTSQEKLYEKEIADYQEKINNFTKIINNHKISSNVLSFIEKNTLPNVWFSNFSVSEIQNEIILGGESDNMDTLSHQVQIFEGNHEYVKNISVLNSQVEQGKIKFTLNISLDTKIFSYVAPVLVSTSENAMGNAQLALEDKPYLGTKKGFSINAPKGWVPDESGKSGTVAIFSENSIDQDGANSFLANISITSGPAKSLDLDTYVTNQNNALSKSLTHYQLVENSKSSVGNLPAYLTDATYTQVLPFANDVRSLQLIVMKNNEVYIITGVALKSNWDQYENVIRSSLLTLTLH